jgi:low molecular weight protein-tyrosine phosphatase
MQSRAYCPARGHCYTPGPPDMASVLVVCTGNVCRSPMAEGFLRRALEDALGDAAPSVASAGTAGWEGSEAIPEAVAAAAEFDVDISAHRGRGLRPDMLDTADLVLCMAREHRDTIMQVAPGAAGRTFTLKELVRLLERLPEDAPGDVAERLAAADELRRADRKPGGDQDVADPMGLPFEGYRVTAAEIHDRCMRLVGDVFAPAEIRPGTET